MSSAQERLDNFLSTYDVKVLNLIIDRHHLSSEKRSWFSIRFASEDPSVEKECTGNMENLDKKIYNIDQDLLFTYGINDKMRTQILRDIKKVRPDDWMDGFSEEI